VAVQRVWDDRRRAYIDLFDPALCVAMRAPRPLSAAQNAALEAGRRQHTHARCWGCDVEVDKSRLSQEGRCPACVTLQAEQAERSAELQALFASAPASTALPDCETMGLGLDAQLVDEVLELDVVDQPGATLFHSLVKPDKRTEWPEEAQEIHGISPTDVAGVPSIAALVPRFEAVLVGVDPGRRPWS
jgi:DNA polymerase-3 subunit epsilon